MFSQKRTKYHKFYDRSLKTGFSVRNYAKKGFLFSKEFLSSNFFALLYCPDFSSFLLWQISRSVA
jgi:hypothetical protein